MIIFLHNTQLTPMNLRIANDSASLSSGDDSLSNDNNRTDDCDSTGSAAAAAESSYALAEVVTLKYPHCFYEAQTHTGQPYNPNDILIFNVSVAEPDNIAYLIDLYTYSSCRGQDEPPHHLGYHYILPNLLRKSDGQLEIPITCATKHRPLGMMDIAYFKITPYRNHPFTMKCSYVRYWNKKWTGLEVGHRGAGTSFKTDDAKIRENTIASLKQAAAHGADMVEFDVQLSKDLVPVIYHDFEVYVSLKRKKSLGENDMLRLPMKDLTLEQLHNLKVYHTVEGRDGRERFFDEDLIEHQPFPTLSDVLDALDLSVGFNVEIKWSQQTKDGNYELENSIDRNLYVDRILNVVLSKAGSRRIVFSCFDPDICTMLRYKQNLYPVMFLTQGVTERYQPYWDPRCNTIESAVSHAYATELLGIVAHTEDLLRDSTQINLATDLGLIVFCWGDDNNSVDTIKLLKEMGVHGIIYDKMDVLSTKQVKKSIFLADGQGSQTDLLRLQDLENRRNRAASIECACPAEPKSSGGGGGAETAGTSAGRTGAVLELQNERERIGIGARSAGAASEMFLSIRQQQQQQQNGDDKEE